VLFRSPAPTGANDAVTGASIDLCAGAGAVDQRGVTRPQGPACDIGAVEVGVVAPAITGPSSDTYVVGAAGGPDVFTASGVPTPHLSISGALPAGVTFVDHGDGTATIAGTPAPATGGVYAVTIHATNGIDPDASAPFTLTVDQPPALAGPSSATFVEGRSSSDTFTATGFPTPALSESGALPAGVTFVDNGDGTAALSGVPAAGTAGTYPVTVIASNHVGADATLAFTLTVAPPVSVVTTSLPDGAVGVAYNGHLVAGGGQPPYTWSITSGALPTGLSLSDDGSITGTPAGPATTSTFTATVTDALNPAGVASRALSITITPGPTSLSVQPALLVISPLKVLVGTASARLTGGVPGLPLAGQTIVFKAGGTNLCSALTGADGVATCNVSILGSAAVVTKLGITAYYGGSPLWLATSGHAGLVG